MSHNATTYTKRRAELETYFDRTAVEGWKKLVSDAPVSRIRQTVRAGRDAMGQALVAMFPDDLAGWRILDAGCGSGPLSAALAQRGADVLGVDLSAQMVEFAKQRWADTSMSGRVSFVAGDMLAKEHGAFDAVVAMDSLIHYGRKNIEAALEGLASRTSQKITFTIAPATPLLSAMHIAGKAFPRGDKSPAIVPAAPAKLMRSVLARPAMEGWREGRSHRVNSGFYISHALEVTRP